MYKHFGNAPHAAISRRVEGPLARSDGLRRRRGPWKGKETRKEMASNVCGELAAMLYRAGENDRRWLWGLILTTSERRSSSVRGTSIDSVGTYAMQASTMVDL